MLWKASAFQPKTAQHKQVVDDDIIICQHTHTLLCKMGMRAEWVDSGQRAIDLVRQRHFRQNHFDVIIIDWKMPEMDGIETTRHIRKIVGDNVTIIVMTAYEWASIENEAKLAGVNMVISKPLFRSSLTAMFEKITSINHNHRL